MVLIWVEDKDKDKEDKEEEGDMRSRRVRVLRLGWNLLLDREEEEG